MAGSMGSWCMGRGLLSLLLYGAEAGSVPDFSSDRSQRPRTEGCLRTRCPSAGTRRRGRAAAAPPPVPPAPPAPSPARTTRPALLGAIAGAVVGAVVAAVAVVAFD